MRLMNTLINTLVNYPNALMERLILQTQFLQTAMWMPSGTPTSVVYSPQEFGEKTANALGIINEIFPLGWYSNQTNPKALNMDLWNNHVGREYGKKAKDKQELLKSLHRALKNGELIIDLNDPRKYTGQKGNPISKSRPVIVLLENEKGRNDVFYDTIKNQVYLRDEFIAKIQAGEYPGYTVKTINGIETPVSKPDGRGTNNLG